ncbi:restriction endonuclease subunit S [Enterobacter cloacae complex sp. P32C]|nr:restriction endonuclease subunit S [Enterobacter cloacae complex sp. P32C]MBY6298085.1 restriction endonuclease subunit S [Enterobacter bugandensis]
MWCQFDHIAKNEANALKAGPFGSALKKSMYVPTGYKIYGQEQVISGDENLGDYYVDREKYESLISCKVQPGDMLISLVGTIGKVLVLSNKCQDGIINPRLVKISLFKDVCRNYIQAVLASKLIQDELFQESHGSTMHVLNLGLLKKLIFPLPPMSEQFRIIDKINALDLLCEHLKSRLQSAQQTQLHLADTLTDAALN